jgi:hypothetical protein
VRLPAPPQSADSPIPPMKTTKLLICAISLVAALAAAKTNAQNISATLLGVSGLPVEGTFDDGNLIQEYPSGVMNFRDVTNSTDFKAFCVEPLSSISYGENLVYQVQDVSLLPNSGIIARLIGRYLASDQTDTQAAALQWAIWKITGDTTSSASLSDGRVRITALGNLQTADLASQYLTNFNNYEPVNLTYLTNSGRQDVVTWNVVPEPGSLMLAAFSGLLLLRRKR